MTMDADIIPLTKHTDSVAVLWATPSFEEVELGIPEFHRAEGLCGKTTVEIPGRLEIRRRGYFGTIFKSLMELSL